MESEIHRAGEEGRESGCCKLTKTSFRACLSSSFSKYVYALSLCQG